MGLELLGALWHGYDNALVQEAIATSAPARVLLAKEPGQVPVRGLGEGRGRSRVGVTVEDRPRIQRFLRDHTRSFIFRSFNS